MTSSIDISIILLFLILNLLVGLYYGKGIKTVKDYAVGDRNFATGTISATIIATWISGSFFTVSVSQTYKEGVWFIPAAIADVVSLLIIGYIFAPRVKEFFGTLSVAESMGKLYGGNVRTMTAICSLAQAIAMIALQIQVFANVFSHFFQFPSIYATLLSSFVVITYSAFGGIKAVTFTDVMQYFTFGIFIPMFALFVWQAFGNSDAISQEFQTNPLLDFTQLLNYNDTKFWPNLVMMLWFMIPSLSSPTFQRMLMARNTGQVSSSFGVAAVGYTVIMIFICIIGLLILAVDSTLDPASVVMYMVDNYSFTGLRGITVIGIMAMVMSTADSWINTGAVIFAHDLCAPLGIKFKNELFLARAFSIVVGICAVVLVLSTSSLFKLFSLQANFYMPIITVPLTMAIFGFRSSAKSVWIGMIAGGLCVILWKQYVQPSTGIDSVIPSMMANLICFVSSHYLLRQNGGWIGIIDDQDLKQIRLRRSRSFSSISQFIVNLPNFNFFSHCNKALPAMDIMYSYFACCSLLSIVTSFAMDKKLYLQNSNLINTLQIVSLFISTIFFCRKLLFAQLFASRLMGIIWYASIFISLAFISSFLVMTSGFSHLSLIVFILSLTTIGVLLSWQAALGMMITGAITALYSYEVFIGVPTAAATHNLELQIVYALFLVGGFMIAFLKPKQDRLETADEKIDYLLTKLDDQRVEIFNALELKNEFLRNLQHESHTPITGIASMAQAIDEGYDKISEENRRKAIHSIAMSTERLLSYVDNLIDVSKISSLNFALDKGKVNLSEMIFDRLNKCRKIYIGDSDDSREFIVNIQQNVIIDGDGHYLERVIDNLIINAIQYCKSGKIAIRLIQNALAEEIEFSIEDEGIGIPPDELTSIFDTFTVSSRTRTPAGGRGLGLALCKKVIELHKGTIFAESDGGIGSIFKFMLPQKL